MIQLVSQFQQHWSFLQHHGIVEGKPTPWDFDIWVRSQGEVEPALSSEDVAPLGLFASPSLPN